MRKQIAILRDAETPRKNSVGHADSIEKILWQLSLLSPDPVRYQGRPRIKERVYDFPVNEVLVSPSLFRRFICTPGCTACCQKFTLDYTPSEFFTLVADKTGFEEREVLVNGKKKKMWTNDQNKNPICDFLTVEKPTGGLGCAHWPAPPLSCVSAPQVQFIQMRPGKTFVLKKPYGRAWAMTPTPQCQFVPAENIEDMQLEDILQILDRFNEWARYFGIKTAIPKVQKFIRNAIKTGMVPLVGIPVWQREV